MTNNEHEIAKIEQLDRIAIDLWEEYTEEFEDADIDGLVDYVTGAHDYDDQARSMFATDYGVTLADFIPWLVENLDDLNLDA